MSALLLLAALGLIALNAFFVAAEFALVRSNPLRLKERADQGGRSATAALQVHVQMAEALAACQVGITLASIAIGFLGEPAIGRLLEPWFGRALGHAAAVTLSVALAFALVTILHVVIGEQVPKLYAIASAERVLAWVALPLRATVRLFRPLVSALNLPTRLILRLLRVKDFNGAHNGAASAQDLKQLIAESATGGQLDQGEAGMLSGVFHLHEQQARQVMTPIPAVVRVPQHTTVETALRSCVASGHTRLLVTDDDDDDCVQGLVHSSDLVGLLLRHGPGAEIQPAIQEAMIVPESKPLDDLLAALQAQRRYLAVVADEYGRAVGIVSVEDIVEEVVGEISDETDDLSLDVVAHEDGWLVGGHVALSELENYGIRLGEVPSRESINSIGGWVFSQLGRMPQAGDEVQLNGYLLHVREVAEQRIKTLYISSGSEPKT